MEAGNNGINLYEAKEKIGTISRALTAIKVFFKTDSYITSKCDDQLYFYNLNNGENIQPFMERYDDDFPDINDIDMSTINKKVAMDLLDSLGRYIDDKR